MPVPRCTSFAGVVLLSAYGCRAGSFVCAEDTECAGQPGGRCELVGHCSFPDPACPSGRRYAGHSGDFSSKCVTADDTATTDVSGTTSSTSAPDSASAEDFATTLALDGDGSTALPPPTSSATGQAVTGDGSTAESADTSTGSSSDSSTETTGEPAPGLCPGPASLEETFDAWPLDPDTWEYYATPSAVAGAPAGVVEVSVDVIAGESSYIDSFALAPLPAAGVAGLEVHAVPAPGLPAELFFGLIDPEMLYGFDLSSGNLVTFERVNPSGFSSRVTVPFDPVDHRWLRMSFTAAGALAWESSADGEQWVEIDAEPAPAALFDLADAQLEISCGAWDGPAVGDPLCAYDNAFICGG